MLMGTEIKLPPKKPLVLLVKCIPLVSPQAKGCWERCNLTGGRQADRGGASRGQREQYSSLQTMEGYHIELTLAFSVTRPVLPQATLYSPYRGTCCMFGPVPSDNIYLSPSASVLGIGEWSTETVNNSSGKIQFMQAEQCCAKIQTLCLPM